MLIQILPGRVCFYISWWDANVQSGGNCWDAGRVELVFYLPAETSCIIRRPGCVSLCVASVLVQFGVYLLL